MKKTENKRPCVKKEVVFPVRMSPKLFRRLKSHLEKDACKDEDAINGYVVAILDRYADQYVVDLLRQSTYDWLRQHPEKAEEMTRADCEKWLLEHPVKTNETVSE
jgi:hypothetical protein